MGRLKELLSSPLERELAAACLVVLKELREYAYVHNQTIDRDGEMAYWSMLQSADHTIDQLEVVLGGLKQTTGEGVQRDGRAIIKGLVEILSGKEPVA